MTSLRFLTVSTLRVLRQALRIGVQRRRHPASWRSEVLETRWLLATRTWTGGAILNDKWSDPQNWENENVPQTGATPSCFPVLRDVTSTTLTARVNNDLPTSRIFDSIVFRTAATPFLETRFS